MDDKVILITGGAGTYGRQFVKAALNLSPKAIRIVDIDEYTMTTMQHKFKDERLRFMYGDIRDRERLRQLFRDVDIIVHTAAIKHVPVAEYNPQEAIKTNVIGSMNVAEIAIELGVGRVIGISSDKAVHPINTYGASKLVMEKLFTEANNYTATKLSCIRFGNFFGSDGSVVDLWREQAGNKEPITVTEKDMSRFWITTDEAVQFTIQCLDRMKGGEVFIPVMPQITLEELLSSLAPECKVKYIGRRRGEKKKEELYSEDEERFITREKDCLIIRNT